MTVERMLETGFLPSAPVAAVFRRGLEEGKDDIYGQNDESAVRTLIKWEKELDKIQFNSADRWLCKVGMQHHLSSPNGDLHDLYRRVNLGPVSRPRCENCKGALPPKTGRGGPPKKYCSGRCSSAAHWKRKKSKAEV